MRALRQMVGLGMVGILLAACATMPPRQIAREVLWEAARECERQIPYVRVGEIDPDGGLMLQLMVSAQYPEGFGKEPFLNCYREKVAEKEFIRNPLCYEGAVAATTPWNEAVQRIYDQVWRVVSEDAAGKDVSLAVVDAPSTLPDAAACGVSRRATVIVSAQTLGRVTSWPDAEPAIVRLIAHELAHVVLHVGRGQEPDFKTQEYEADELGVYYFERAGFDCQKWVQNIGISITGQYDTEWNLRQAAKAACNLAKAGRKPPRRAAP